MLRIIAHCCNAGMAANVGGTVHETHRTFDIELPELEAWLRANDGTHYSHAQVTGVEVLAPPAPPATGETP
jgi:hypothetical protein